MHDKHALRDTAGTRRLPHARILVLALAVVALLIAVHVRLSGGRGESMDSRAGATRGDVLSSASSGSAANIGAGAGIDAAARASARATDTAGRAPAGVRSAMRRQFDAAEDLFDYAQRIAPEVQSGNAEATWLMSRVADYCAGYAMDPAGFARDSGRLAAMELPVAATMAAARERVSQRCRRFSPLDGLSPSYAQQLRLDAAHAGSLAAETELLAMGQPLSESGDYGRGLLERVRRSLDPEAVSALATAAERPGTRTGTPMGAMTTATAANDVGAAFVEPDVAPQFREIIWQLAACRLGMDCGPRSTLMTSYCVNGGICSRNPGQGFEEFVYDAAVPRQSADLVRDAVTALIDQFGEET